IIYLIGKVKAQIPRCERAFALLEKSVGLLRDRFAEYHRDVVTSQNPLILFERFVGDVAQNTSAKDARLAGEFRRIIQFFQKQIQARSATMDPHIARVFEVANENINLIAGADADEGEEKIV